MSAFEIKSGENVHCVELNSGRKLTGNFKLDQDGIITSIHSYEGQFFIRSEEPIILLTEKNVIVSLHSNITTLPSSNFLNEPLRTIYRQTINSNIAVIGRDGWTTTDKVKRVNFRVKHTEELLRHQAKIKRLVEDRVPNKDHFSLYSEFVNGITMRAGYTVSYSKGPNTGGSINPLFELDFKEGETLQNYTSLVDCCVQFLSFSLGIRLKPSDIRISRHAHDEILVTLGKLPSHPDHQVHYVWPRDEINSDDIRVRGSPVSAWDDEELSSLRQCIVSWVERFTQWRNAYALMMSSLALRSEISANRLITACKWFEQIPLTRSENSIDEEHISVIASAAAQKANELGYKPEITQRIVGSLKVIRRESDKERFSRLVKLVRQRFGYSIFPENGVLHLRRAIKFRGKTAHGHFHPADKTELRAFIKATYAMEAICYLLTALELPIQEEGLKRVQYNPVVDNYLRAYE